MAKIVRTVLKPIALLLAVFQNASAAPIVGSPTSTDTTQVDPSSLTALVKRLDREPALRARFLRDPGAVFRETGIDPSPYNLPDRMDAAQLDRFLRDWIGSTGPAAGSRVYVAPPGPEILAANMMPPVAVYGPPPLPVPEPPRDKPKDNPKPPPDDTVKPHPTTPAPVYGPPPGSPR